MSTITCPHCDGKRQVYAFLNHGPDYRTHTSGYVQCSTCQGMGAITTGHAERIETGKRMRAERIERETWIQRRKHRRVPNWRWELQDARRYGYRWRWRPHHWRMRAL